MVNGDIENLNSEELPNEFENAFDFEEGLLNPKSEKKHDWLTRDAVLGNITTQNLTEIRIGSELVQILKYLKLPEAADFFVVDMNVLFVASRSVEGYWTRMMRTTISELKGWKKEEMEKKGFKTFFNKNNKEQR